MRTKTDSTHPSFGVVRVTNSRKDKWYVDGELHLRQCNGDIYLTPLQIVELRDILNQVISEKEK